MGELHDGDAHSSSTLDTLRRFRRSVVSAQGIRGTAVEAAWITTHLAMYPLGLVQERARLHLEHTSLEGLPPTQRGLLVGDVIAAGTPIVLMHGLVDNRSIFATMRRSLSRKGFGSTYALNYSPLTDDIRAVAVRLDELVDEVREETGHDQVHIIGHSMGGLIGRYLVQRLGGGEKVHTLVTMGTPHSGTAPARFVPHPVVQQMRPDSDLIEELALPAPGCSTRIVAFWSDLDQFMIPKQNARVDHQDLHARNVFIPGAGHMSLPVDRRVIHDISTTLAHLDTPPAASDVIQDSKRSTGA
ncbi:MAG: alpha/beta fold hydrolase [Candidatus Nanopelagicales bacterium]